MRTVKRKVDEMDNILTVEIAVPRSIPIGDDSMKEVELRVFGDASLTGVTAVVYGLSLKYGME